MTELVLQFLNFHYRSNKDWSEVNFNDSIKLPYLENPLLGARFSAVAFI